MGAFAQVENSDILRYLSYDNTVVAQRLNTQGKVSKAQSNSKPRVQSTNPCFAYNRPEGCRNDPCRFKHACSTCGTLGHVADKCQKGEAKK